MMKLPLQSGGWFKWGRKRSLSMERRAQEDVNGLRDFIFCTFLPTCNKCPAIATD